MSCNNKNGRLDRALLTPFEIMTVLKGVRRKGGKKPTIDGFASVASSHDQNGPVLYINREKYAVDTPTGKRLSGTNNADPIKDYKWSHRPDGQVEVSYKQELRFDRKAVRALFKIAIETIAHFEGLEAARNPELDAVKHFVMNGGGQYRALIMPDPNPNYESYFHKHYKSTDSTRICGMTIFGIGFLCDFDPEFLNGKLLMAEAVGQGINAQVIPNWPRQLWRDNNPLKS